MKYLKGITPLFLMLGTMVFCLQIQAEHLVILHTNDTHSSIDPMSDGTSGILQRKAILDSVRNVEKNVITVDAGDVVQGTLYFKYFGGDVEYPLMNMSGYDYRIVGNHEFDNGMESLAKYYKAIEGEPLSANYDFTGTELEGVFKPYSIREIGDKKIGFIGINLDPASIISQKNIHVNFKEVIPVANEMAAFLKQEKNCDMVVVVSHIGYGKVNEKTSDVELAQASRDIDLIIGGHTHTLIDPEHPEINPSLIENIEGKPVRIVQAGKQGIYIGKVTVDLDRLPLSSGEELQYELIPVTDRFDSSQLDKTMIDFLEPYRNKVDSVNHVVIAYSAYDLEKERTGGLANLTADIGYAFGREMAEKLKLSGEYDKDVDLAIMNVGGIRHPMPKGAITEGQILSTYPFSNKFVLIEVKGSDIIEALKISARKGGEAVSSQIRVITDSNGNLKNVILNGRPMDPSKYYTVATIDYVAEGNDDLVSLANHKKIYESDEVVAVPILNWIKQQQELGLMISPDCNSRFVVDVNDVVK
ncbi:MAG: bifunctional metallophosphatase/5'-nucleotidase [Muribaculaceae bacterium]|nr:bifunctional metallophosphatase/5'-nucleotidase [Muribaculaceae bacterium]